MGLDAPRARLRRVVVSFLATTLWSFTFAGSLPGRRQDFGHGWRSSVADLGLLADLLKRTRYSLVAWVSRSAAPPTENSFSSGAPGAREMYGSPTSSRLICGSTMADGNRVPN